jgi:hypothetical protein
VEGCGTRSFKRSCSGTPEILAKSFSEHEAPSQDIPQSIGNKKRKIGKTGEVKKRKINKDTKQEIEPQLTSSAIQEFSNKTDPIIEEEAKEMKFTAIGDDICYFGNEEQIKKQIRSITKILDEQRNMEIRN